MNWLWRKGLWWKASKTKHQARGIIFWTTMSNNIRLPCWMPDVTAAVPVSNKLLEPAPKNAQQVNTQLLNKRLTLAPRHIQSSTSTTGRGTSGLYADPQRIRQTWNCEGGEQGASLLHHSIQWDDIQKESSTHPSCCRAATATALHRGTWLSEHRPPHNGQCPPTPQTQESNTRQSHTSPLRPTPKTHFPTKNSNTLYTTRSGRTCRLNPNTCSETYALLCTMWFE